MLDISSQELKHGVTLEAGNSIYHVGIEEQRQSIIDNYGWTINDGGSADLKPYITTIEEIYYLCKGDDDFDEEFIVVDYDEDLDIITIVPEGLIESEITTILESSHVVNMYTSEFIGGSFMGNNVKTIKVIDKGGLNDFKVVNFKVLETNLAPEVESIGVIKLWTKGKTLLLIENGWLKIMKKEN